MRSRSSIATSIMVLMLAAFSIGGATMAWFTASADLDESVFTAGTVLVSNPVITSDGGSWQAGQSNTITWSFTNTGSKRTFLRVRPDIEMQFYAGTTEYSAWIDGTRINPNQWFGQYVIYEKGEATLDNPRRADLLEGSNANHVGHVEFCDDGTYLYIGYHMTEDYLLDEIQIYAGLTAPTHSTVGQYPFKFTFDTGLREFFWFETDHIYDQLETPRVAIPLSTLADGTEIYLGAHCRLFQVSRYLNYSTGGACGDQWTEGSDGWWYYGTAAGPISVAPGETVEVCFEFFIDEGFDGEITFSLEAEAVQSTHNAIHYVWPANPWNTLPNPSLSIAKTANPTTAAVGETINYTIVVTNDGNVTLNSVSVVDAMLGIDETVASLAPGASSTFTGAYTVGAGDAGTLVNTATASAAHNGQTISANASATVTVSTPDPSLSVTKTANSGTAAVGETITYTITVTNDGNVTLTNVSVVDTMLGLNSTIASLAPGASQTFIEDYVVAAGDLGTLENTVNVSATYNGQAVSASATAFVEILDLTAFSELAVGELVIIDGTLFQKIGENWVLLRGTHGPNSSRDNAVSAGIDYAAIFPGSVVSSSRLLTSEEAGLLNQAEIRNIGNNWWTSTITGNNQYWYVDSAGALLSTNQKNNAYGIRPSLLLQPGLYVTGDGTAEDPYVLFIPD